MAVPFGDGGERQRLESEKAVLDGNHDLVQKRSRWPRASDVHTEAKETGVVHGSPAVDGVLNDLVSSEGLVRLDLRTQADVELLRSEQDREVEVLKTQVLPKDRYVLEAAVAPRDKRSKRVAC